MRLKKQISNISLIAFLSVLCSYCYGNFSALQFKEYNKKNSGIPHNEITHIAEDSHGFIWVASAYGLRRFDGIDFDTLESMTGNPQSKLLDVEISTLFFDSDNNLWIGTLNNGVYQLNTNTNRFKHFNEGEQSLTFGYIREIVEDNNSNVWIATQDGINKFNLLSERMTLFNKQELGIDDEGIYSFEYSPIDNLLWIGTSMGIIHFDATTHAINTITDNFHTFSLNQPITYIYFDEEQNVWIGTPNSLFVYDTNKQIYIPVFTPVNRPLNYVFSISRDNNNLWVGTHNELLVIDIQSLNLLWSIPATNSLTQKNTIYHIHINSNHQLWIATQFKGLWKANLNSMLFDVFSTNDKKSIKDNRVYAIFEDKNQNSLISTLYGGLDYFHKAKDQWLHYPTSFFSSEHKNSDVFSIIGDSKERIWLNTSNKIIQYNTETDERSLVPVELYQPPFHNDSTIYKIFYDTQQRLWVLGKQRWLILIDLNTGKRIVFDSQQHLKNHDVNAIYETNDQKIWLITNQGLMSYDENKNLFEKHNIKVAEITNPAIFTIDESSDSSLWLGTSYGLVKYNNKNEIVNYTVKDGLSNNVIVGILADDNENLWIATLDGLNRFHYPTKKFYRFYEEDGLPDNEFDAYTSYKSRNGKLYFAGPGGGHLF